MGYFHAEMVHNEKTVSRLFSVRYELQKPMQKGLLQLFSCVLIFFSLFLVSKTWFSLLLMFIGCMLFTNAAAPPRQAAAAARRTLSLPISVKYCFYDSHFTTVSGETTSQIFYHEIAYLLMDQSYIYMFTCEKTGYMFSRGSLAADPSGEFLTFLKGKTGQRCCPTGLASYLALIRMIKNHPRRDI